MTDAGKLMIFAGIALAVLGGVVYTLGRVGFRGLPGDVHYNNGGLRVYFPIVTCIVLSIALTLGSWLWRWFSRR